MDVTYLAAASIEVPPAVTQARVPFASDKCLKKLAEWRSGVARSSRNTIHANVDTRCAVHMIFWWLVLRSNNAYSTITVTLR